MNVWISLKNRIRLTSHRTRTVFMWFISLKNSFERTKCCTTSRVGLRQQGVTVEEDGRLPEEQKKKVPAWRSPSTRSSRPPFSAPTRSPCYTKRDFWVKVSLECLILHDVWTPVVARAWSGLVAPRRCWQQLTGCIILAGFIVFPAPWSSLKGC